MLLKQCGTICDHSEIKCKLQHLSEKSILSSVVPSDDVTLYVKIRYIVLSNTGAPSLEQIQAQHNLINRVCNREHLEELKTVPTNSYYASFASVIDKPWNIRFLPIDRPLSEDDDIERHVISENTVFSNIDEIIQANNYIKPGVLNCYITKLTGSLLGQAYVAIDPGVFVIDIGTVGGVDSNGNIVHGTGGYIQYDTGKTAIHEIGHCFGLEHTFSGTCEPDDHLYHDIPLQKYPNFDATITQNSNGEYVGANDNRYWDCNKPNATRIPLESPFSCIDSNDCLNENVSYEMFFNVMDYGSDDLCLVFAHTQVATVRNFLIMTDMYIQKEDLKPNNNNNTTDDDSNNDNSQIKKTTTINCKHNKNTWIYWLPIIIISVVLFISGVVGIFLLVKKSKVT